MKEKKKINSGGRFNEKSLEAPERVEVWEDNR